MLKLVVGVAVLVATSAGSLPGWAQTPIPPSPKNFAMAASQSDQYEIQAARVAEVEGSDPRVRAFAQRMIRDHSRSNEELRQAAAASGMPPLQPGMSSDQAALLSSLQSLRGADFDQTYARQQTLAHAQADAVEESFASAGADPNLRKAAEAALPMIQDHLRSARKLRDQVGGS